MLLVSIIRTYKFPTLNAKNGQKKKNALKSNHKNLGLFLNFFKFFVLLCCTSTLGPHRFSLCHLYSCSNQRLLCNMASSTDIKGFHILQIRLPESLGKHYIYFRRHEAKAAQDVTNLSGRLLFMFNLPIETNFSLLKKYFQQVAIGAIVEKFIPSVLTDSSEEAYFDLTKLSSDLEYKIENPEKELGKRLPKNCGIITFLDKASLQLALSSLRKCSSSKKTTNWPMPTLGSQYLTSVLKSQVHDPKSLSRAVSSALAAFTRSEQESREELKNQTEIVDEDGFTLVVGSHRKTKAGILSRQKYAQTVALENAKLKIKKKEKEDFYRFQLRERKKAEMNDLLQKFKQDQERIRVMREKRRFRPY